MGDDDVTITPINLGYGGLAAQIMTRPHDEPSLFVFEAAVTGDFYVPASSVQVYGRDALVALRDALNFALEPPTADGSEPTGR
jgi:hypothetical protein